MTVRSSDIPSGKQTLWYRFIEDTYFLVILATVAMCASIIANFIRDRPLPWLYESKADRIGGVVVQLMKQGSRSSDRSLARDTI